MQCASSIGHERAVELREQRAEAGEREPLGRDVDQLVRAAREPRDAPAQLVGGERRGEEGGGDAARLERRTWSCISAIERRDDERGAGQQARRQLVDEALAAAGGRDEQQAPRLEQRLDRLALAGPERVVAEPRQPRVEVQISHSPDHSGRPGQDKSRGSGPGAPSWREILAGTDEYRMEIGVLMGVLGVHRAAPREAP